MLRSIRTKVLLYQIALIVFVTVVTGFTAFYLMKGHLLSLQREKLEFVATSEARDMEARFGSLKNLFTTITSTEVLEGYEETYSPLALVEHFSKFGSDFPDLSYANFYGTEEFRLIDGELTDDLRDISDTVLFQDATWTPGKLYASDVQPGPEGMPSLSLSIARDTFFGEKIGVITATVPLKDIASSITNFTVGETGFIMILRNDGTILWHPNKSIHFSKIDGDALKMLSGADSSGPGFERATLFGTDSLVAFAPVKDTGWVVAGVLPYAEFIAGPNVLRKYLAVASVSIILLVSLIALIGVRGTTSALSRLSEAARAIASGDLRQRVYTGSGDEVEVLANSFNTMAEQLERSYKSLHNLSAHLLSVREEERKAVAREVHDELGQVLSALKIDLSWMQKRLPDDRAELVDKAASMRELIDSTIDIVQNITAELRPLVLDDLGLAAAIESEAEKFKERTGMKCEVHVEDFDIDLSLSAAVFRVFQETMLNVVRHSEASRVSVELKSKDGALRMTVKDNGKGITQAEAGAPTSFGIMGMRERILALGGSVDIEGKDNMGTTVTVTLPLKHKGEA